MKSPIKKISIPQFAATFSFALLLIPVVDAEITVVSERRGNNFPTDGTFLFETVPSNTSEDLANGKSFIVLAGEPNAGGPISNLTNGLAQTNADSVAESFFAFGTTIRIQLDLETATNLDQINTYSWHANARAPQFYRVYGATSPSNNAPDFDDAPFQDDTALASLGYTLIADVATPQISGGQYGTTIANPEGNLGTYRYLLFDMAPPVFGVGPRPTFYGEIDVIASEEQPPSEIPLTITQATPPETGFILEWASSPGKGYNLRSSGNLADPFEAWAALEEGIAPTPPSNTYRFAPEVIDPRLFFVVEEFNAPASTGDDSGE